MKRSWNSAGSGNFSFLMKSRRENCPPLGKLNKFLNRRNEKFWMVSFFVEEDRDCEIPSWKLNLRAIADVSARCEEVNFRDVLLILENCLIRLILFDNLIILSRMKFIIFI